MIRIQRIVWSILLVLVGAGAIGLKAWTTFDGPYLEGLPDHDFCAAAEEALANDHVIDALELAEAGDCPSALERAQEQWDRLAAVTARCWDGVWTGYGAGDAGFGCAVASDLFLFGDVRDLTRQGLAWGRGDETDPVLVALSTAGVVLTLAPGAGAGTALVKVARRTGTLSRPLAESVTLLVRQRAWRPLSGLLDDAARMSRRLGPARATRAIAYADTPAELAALARFVERAPSPLLALRWGGKGVTRITDDALYRAALQRGPRGVALAAERGGAALLSRTPFVVFAAKSLVKHPEAIAAMALAIATWILRWPTWPIVLAVGGAMVLLGVLVAPRRRATRKGRRARTGSPSVGSPSGGS